MCLVMTKSQAYRLSIDIAERLITMLDHPNMFYENEKEETERIHGLIQTQLTKQERGTTHENYRKPKGV